MHWTYLTFGIVAEVIATAAVKASAGLTNLWPTLLMAVGYACSFFCLSKAVQVIPVGVAYAVWSGAGIVLITMLAWWWYRQHLDVAAVAGMALIVIGVIVLRVFSKVAQ